jgi:hypothetical protein
MEASRLAESQATRPPLQRAGSCIVASFVPHSRDYGVARAAYDGRVYAVYRVEMEKPQSPPAATAQRRRSEITATRLRLSYGEASSCL